MRILNYLPKGASRKRLEESQNQLIRRYNESVIQADIDARAEEGLVADVPDTGTNLTPDNIDDTTAAPTAALVFTEASRETSDVVVTNPEDSEQSVTVTRIDRVTFTDGEANVMKLYFENE